MDHPGVQRSNRCLIDHLPFNELDRFIVAQHAGCDHVLKALDRDFGARGCENCAHSRSSKQLPQRELTPSPPTSRLAVGKSDTESITRRARRLSWRRYSPPTANISTATLFPLNGTAPNPSVRTLSRNAPRVSSSIKIPRPTTFV